MKSIRIRKTNQDKPLEADFTGYGGIATNDGGKFRFTTFKPGQGPDANRKPQASHILMPVFSRGLLPGVVTQF